MAEQHVASSMAGLLITTTSIWMALFAWFFIGRRMPAVAAVGLLLGFTGAGVLVLGGDENHSSMIVYIGIVIVAAVLWAAGSIYGIRADLPSSRLLGASMEMLCGSAGLLVIAFGRGEPAALRLGEIAPASALALAYLILFGSLISYSTYMWLLSNAPAWIVSTHCYVNPMVAVFLGWEILGESVTSPMVAGSVVIIAATAMVISAGE
jgi:drug/metabolite transporter (DMT)-like permease